MQNIVEKLTRRRKIMLGTLVLAIIISAALLVDLYETRNEAGTLVGDMENIIVMTDKGPVNTVAKIDTGADFSAIDQTLAQSMNLKPANLKRRVLSAQGIQVRQTAAMTFVLGNKEISTIVSLADRSQLNAPIIIGRNDLQGFTIDPNRQFLNEPKTPSQRFSLASFFVRAANRAVNKQIIIIPILGAIVVILRILLGVRTFGIFGPVVIALSLILMQPNVWQGVLIYVFLIAIGAGAKILMLNRLQLPNIAEMSLIMSIIVLSLVGFSYFPLNFQLTITTVFFPLIITTHIIERFSKTSEEHQLGEAFTLLVSTLLVAIFLMFIGSYLVNKSLGVIWALFGLSILLTIVVGMYNGLRFSEFLRFKFLKKK